jgi:hypothetical protein
MLRIPSSHNSKCIPLNHEIADSTTQVRVIQDWSTNTKQKAPIYLLLGNFLAYLVDRKFELAVKKQRRYNNKHANIAHPYNDYSHNDNSNSSRLEKLLQNPIADHRKFVCYWLLSRYLINVKHLSYEQAYAVIKNWLLKCSEVERLSPSIRAFDIQVKHNIKDVQKSGKIPIGEKLLKDMNEELYKVLLPL